MSDQPPNDQSQSQSYAEALAELARVTAAGQSARPAQEEKQQLPLPETFEIPAAIVNHWVSLPSTTALHMTFTRQDWDHLFFALDYALTSIAAMDRCIVHYSNGEIDQANNEMWDTRRRVIEGHNRLRQFMTGLMASAGTI